MTPVVKICLILFGIAYLISPFDIVPDLLVPYLGWLDDGAVLWTVYHLIRYGKLPWSRKTPPGSAENFQSAESESAETSSGPHGKNTNGAHTKNTDGPKTSRAKSKSSMSVSDAYKILEISSKASWQEIQAAYRDKSKKYHPDKVSHLGKEFSQLANEKFIEIQNAYELLKREKGR